MGAWAIGACLSAISKLGKNTNTSMFMIRTIHELNGYERLIHGSIPVNPWLTQEGNLTRRIDQKQSFLASPPGQPCKP